MLHDVVQRKKFYTLVLQKCLTRSYIGNKTCETSHYRRVRQAESDDVSKPNQMTKP